MKYFDISSFAEMAETMRRPFHDNYLAMYSSVYGGIVKDPVLMMIPLDDHMAHRGDGIFETMKCVDGNIYNMKAHLERLSHAASVLAHNLPYSLEETGRIVVETVRAGGEKNCLIRLFVSRGSGSFGVNPYDCPKAHLYVAITRHKYLSPAVYKKGVRLKTSKIPVKHPFFATIKHCNYLANVLMAKEVKDAGVDFVAAFDGNGHLAEGATENIGIVTQDRKLLFPKLEGILCGTTMMRVVELAREKLVSSGELEGTDFTDIDRTAMLKAEEVLVVGTTPDVIGVTEFDGKPVGTGVPGGISVKLYDLMQADIRGNKKLLTAVFE